MPRSTKPKSETRPTWAIEGLVPLQEGDPDHVMAKVMNCSPHERLCSKCRRKGPLFVIGLFEEGKRPELLERCRICAVSIIREKGLPLWVSGNSSRTRQVWTTGKFPDVPEERKEALRRGRAARCNDKPAPESGPTTRKTSAFGEGLPF